ncbi:MAG: hypothetical protein LBC35_00520 [Coriobacteriales bacterium]|jgi:homocitrate synthase NifV|nr:hypothetical protein [Coriobacteriales bacterium]
MKSSAKTDTATKTPVRFNDVTLRDGEQAAFVVFSLSEKLRIAQLLDDIGVNQIEAGIPAMGGEEKLAVEKIASFGLRCMVSAWSRAVIPDIRHCVDCQVEMVEISLPTSDLMIEKKLHKSRRWVLESIRAAVAFAKEHGLRVAVGAEDASRTDIGFLVEYATAAQREGAERLRYCDTIGLLDPFKTAAAVSALVSALREKVNIDVEIHSHNDFGMATANSLAAAQSGACWINTTLGGLGERAGNAPLEEVAMALKHIQGMDTGLDESMFAEAVRYTMLAAGRETGVDKPIVGAHIFSHESGLHVDGILKLPQTYEPYVPKSVLSEHRIVIGKHTGSHAIIAKMQALGISLSPAAAVSLLPVVRARAIRNKRALNDVELAELVGHVVSH